MKRYTIAQLQQMRESEDHVEFKKGEYGNVSYNGAGKDKPKDRRKCILGYVTALCNEGGGRMVIGMHDKHPHRVTGTKQNENALGELESNIYRDSDIRTEVYELFEDEVNRTGRVVVIEVPSRPIGNLLTTPSMPRNRLLADILAKTGIVERSGQGMDKIFLKTLSEGKPDPDYTESDDFNVTAILSATVKDKAFAIYVQSIQQSLPEDKKLTVFDVMALCEVRDGKKVPSNKQIAQKLEQMGFLEKHGKTNAIHYILPRRYYEFAGDVAAYSLATDWDINQVWAVIKPFLNKYGKAKISDLEKLVGSHVSEKQMRSYLDALRKDGRLKTEGKNKYLYYVLGKGE